MFTFLISFIIHLSFLLSDVIYLLFEEILLQRINSFNFPLSENVFISALFLKDIFSGCQFMDPFCLEILKTLFYFVPDSIIFSQEFCSHLNHYSPITEASFFSGLFLELFFVSDLQPLFVMYLDMDFFAFFLFEV